MLDLNFNVHMKGVALISTLLEALLLIACSNRDVINKVLIKLNKPAACLKAFTNDSTKKSHCFETYLATMSKNLKTKDTPDN